MIFNFLSEGSDVVAYRYLGSKMWWDHTSVIFTHVPFFLWSLLSFSLIWTHCLLLFLDLREVFQFLFKRFLKIKANFIQIRESFHQQGRQRKTKGSSNENRNLLGSESTPALLLREKPKGGKRFRYFYDTWKQKLPGSQGKLRETTVCTCSKSCL